MPIVQCPSCRDDVTAPENPPADAVVRCPLCNDEFELAKVIDAMPPALIIVSGGDEKPLEVGPASGMSGAEAAAASFDFSEKEAPSAKPKSTSTTRSTAARRSSRTKKRQSNPLWEVFKVVGGGVVGLSIGYMILLWGFQRDPIPLAPKIPASMQWILPAALRTTSEDAGESDDGGNVGSFPMGDAGDLPFGVDGDAGPAAKGDAGNASAGLASPPAPKPNPPRANPRRNRARSSAANSNTKAPATVVRVSNSPAFGPDDLETAIDGARVAMEAWESAKNSGDDVNAAAREFYTQFAKLGHTIAYADASSPVNRKLAEQAAALAEALPGAARNMFGAASASWLRNKRTNDGVALYGDVTRIEKQGDLYETIIKLTDRGGRRVTVVSGADPRTRFKTGDQVLVLGGIIEDPAERIEGYEGLAPMVVLGGLPVKYAAVQKQAENPKPPEPVAANPKEADNPSAPTAAKGDEKDAAKTESNDAAKETGAAESDDAGKADGKNADAENAGAGKADGKNADAEKAGAEKVDGKKADGKNADSTNANAKKEKSANKEAAPKNEPKKATEKENETP